MVDVDLDPHPLVTKIAEGLEGVLVPLSRAPQALGKTSAANNFGLRFAGSANLPELVTFTGYLGATFVRDAGDAWSVLYLDTRLQSWLLIQREGIVFRDKRHDEKAPLGKRDVVWVKATASVGSGTGALSVEAQFLTGSFTQAADFDTAPAGGTLAAATGVFCEATSLNCCKPRTLPR